MRHFIRTISLLLVFVSLFGMTFSMSSCSDSVLECTPSTLFMRVGETAQITASQRVLTLTSSHIGKMYGPDSLEFVSDNPWIADVDEQGNVTARNPGSTKIYVTLKSNSDMNKVIYVTVAEVKSEETIPETSVVTSP